MNRIAERTGREKPILSVKQLDVRFGSGASEARAVNGVSYDLFQGETLGVVGESGSGKSVTLLAAIGLLPSPPGRVAGGQVLFDGRDLLHADRRELRRIRGGEIGFIFQDPTMSLNPVMRIGDQITETLLAHGQSTSRRDALARVAQLLQTVGISDPVGRLRQYPHEFSGGMRQRVMIAIAIANSPKVLIADEPTTALDVTVQAQVLEVMRRAQREVGAATILVSHDLGVIAQMATRVVVMYAGFVVEVSDVVSLFARPFHPYTAGLMACSPTLESDAESLVPIPGQPPQAGRVSEGCAFFDRCAFAQEVCRTQRPELREVSPGRLSACHFAESFNVAEPGGGCRGADRVT